MRRCSGNNTEEWGFDSIFEIECPSCGNAVEFFKDETRRNCPKCKNPVINNREDTGCGQWCSSASSHIRNFCPRFRRSKARYWGHNI